MNTTLKLFSDPHLLRQVGRPLLAKFFQCFTQVLPSKYFLPNPRVDNDAYFDSLATVLERTSELPATLLKALLEIEALATKELENRSQNIPISASQNFSVSAFSSDAPLSQPIEAWLRSTAASPTESPNSDLPSSSSAPQISAFQHVSVSAFSEEAPLTEAPSSEAPPTDLQSPNSELLAPNSDQQVFSLLAQLPIPEYDRVRRAEAKRLHLRLSTLDTEVARCRSQIDDDAQANAVKFPVIEPWPTPVLDAPELFHQVAGRYTNHIILPLGAADIMALFTGHCHSYTAFYQTPRLNLYSPRRGCGKTTTMDVLATMVPRPFRTENLRAAVLFRVVDQKQPVLLLDEVDTYLHQADELRGLLNAGHKRGACAYRCEGAGNAIRAFKAFAPAVLAGIGELPATLHDRSILIRLVPAEQGQAPARFNEHHTEIEKILASKLARWAKDNYDALAACDPVLPPSAFNRVADNWRPIFAVAEIIGGDWPARALAAYNHLTAEQNHQQSTLNYQLLSSAQNHQLSTVNVQLLLTDLRDIFTKTGVPRMFSSTIVNSLRVVPDRPWSVAHNGRRIIDQPWLARQLRPFGVAPHNVRIGTGRAKGYDLADFAQVFTQLLNGG